MAVIFGCLLTCLAFAMLVSLAVSSLYYAHVFRYWKKRGVHYLEPSLFFGNFAGVALHRESPAELLRKVYKQTTGHPLVGIYAFNKPQLVVRDLHLVQNILGKDSPSFLDRDFSPPESTRPLISRSMFVLKGRKWNHTRMKLTPAFTSGEIKSMLPVINERSAKLVLCINQEISKGNAVDVRDVATRFSTDVIASCAFGVDTSALAEPGSELHLAMLEVIEPGVIHKLVLVLFLFLPWILSVLGAVAFPGRVSEFVRMTFWDIIEHRKKSRTVRKELGDLKDDQHYAKYSHNHELDFELAGDDMVSQAFAFVLVSHETSSSIITFTLYELALKPAIQDRLRGEITAVLGRNNTRVTCDAIDKMIYLDMVVSESMRKYPILPTLERLCVSDYKVPGTEVTIEKGTAVIIPLLGIHSDPGIYPEPDKFDPERFNCDNRRKRPQFAYQPLGGGTRISAGLRFGQLQVKTALVHILKTFRVWSCPVTPRPPLKTRAYRRSLSTDKKIVLAFTELR